MRALSSTRCTASSPFTVHRCILCVYVGHGVRADVLREHGTQLGIEMTYDVWRVMLDTKRDARVCISAFTF